MNGVTRFVFNGNRFYSIPGFTQPFPSVTTILSVINKPHLLDWEKRVTIDAIRQAMMDRPAIDSMEQQVQWVDDVISAASRKRLEARSEATDLGTRAHEYIDDFLFSNQFVDTAPDDLRTVIEGFESWKEQADLFFVKKDTVVWSPTYRYAGAMDALARKISGSRGLVVLDWKISSGFRNEYAYQIAAYAKALEDMTGKEVEEGWVVRFDRNKPLFEARKVKSLDNCFEVFKSALLLWRATHGDPWDMPLIGSGI